MVQGLVDMTSWLYKCLPWGRAGPKLGRSCLRLDQILLLANLTGPYQIFNQTAFFYRHNCTITSDFSFQALDDPKATCGYLHGTEACYSHKSTCRILAAERGSDLPSLPGSQEALEQEAKGLGGLSKGLTVQITCGHVCLELRPVGHAASLPEPLRFPPLLQEVTSTVHSLTEDTQQHERTPGTQ